MLIGLDDQGIAQDRRTVRDRRKHTGKPPDERFTGRQQHAGSLLADLERCLQATLAQIRYGSCHPLLAQTMAGVNALMR